VSQGDTQLLAYDANIGQVVLFGGDSPGGGQLNDTWSWNGTTWSQIQTPFTPSGRSGASMNYAPDFKGLVLFGGYLGNGSYTSETWLFTSVR
jgi:Galactose oxidase, central domain